MVVCRCPALWWHRLVLQYAVRNPHGLHMLLSSPMINSSSPLNRTANSWDLAVKENTLLFPRPAGVVAAHAGTHAETIVHQGTCHLCGSIMNRTQRKHRVQRTHEGQGSRLAALLRCAAWYISQMLNSLSGLTRIQCV